MVSSFVKKTVCVICAAAVCIVSSSCGKQQDKIGGELIRAAREDYVSLDSAKVIMTNTATGETEQTFTFKYDEKDILIYSYYGKSENSEFAQYNNGAESFTYENGKYSHAVKGDSDYVRYTRAATYPQAGEGLIIYEPKYVVSDSEKKNDDGTTEYTHVYDAEKIGAEAEKGEVTGFSVQYLFDSKDKLVYFIETTEAQVDSEKKTYSYKVEITEQNAVTDVENTTDKYKT